MLLRITKANPSKVFPQANDIHKVIKYVDMQAHNRFEHYLSTISFEFVPRQFAYYRSAAAYLGLIDHNGITDLAAKIFSMDKDNMLLSLACLILENEVFYIYYKNRNTSEIAVMLKDIYQFTNKTATRRSSTVKQWVNWCDIILEEHNFEVEGDENHGLYQSAA